MAKSKESQLRIAKQIIRATLWMARRYADKRSTYATYSVNLAIDLALAELGIETQPDPTTGELYATDGMLGKWDPKSNSFVDTRYDADTSVKG